jgi:hypothetical protein
VTRPIPERSPSTSLETRRERAIGDVDVLLESAAALRAELRIFEAALRKGRRHLVRGGAAAELNEAIDIATARENLSQVAADFQAARYASRLSVFRVQAAEGMSIGAIARSWGLSRQLISRMMKEPPSDQSSGKKG